MRVCPEKLACRRSILRRDAAIQDRQHLARAHARLRVRLIMKLTASERARRRIPAGMFNPAIDSNGARARMHCFSG